MRSAILVPYDRLNRARGALATATPESHDIVAVRIDGLIRSRAWNAQRLHLILSAAEHFFAGLLTTSMFAFMMARVDRTIGAAHYTLLATIEVLGKTPPSLLSGVHAGALGYGPAFSIGLFAAALWPLAAGPLSRRAPPAD